MCDSALIAYSLLVRCLRIYSVEDQLVGFVSVVMRTSSVLESDFVVQPLFLSASPGCFCRPEFPFLKLFLSFLQELGWGKGHYLDISCVDLCTPSLL